MKIVNQLLDLRKIITRLRESSYQSWFADAPQGREAELMLIGSTRPAFETVRAHPTETGGESAANGKQEPRRAVEPRIQLCL